MSQSSFPGWATMGDSPSSSSVASDEEMSPMPEPPPTAIRKRKGSPKVSASQHKRPKAIHSATEPTPATKHPFGSSLKGKGKQRQKSLDSDSGSLDFDISAELEVGSSQQVASSSTAHKPANKKWNRKSTGTIQTRQKTKNAGKPAFLSASASTPSQTHARQKTPNVHGEFLELSTDDDDPKPRPVTQLAKPIVQDDIIVIDSDSEPDLPPSKSRPAGPLSIKNNTKIPHSLPSNPPAGFRMVDNVLELISSDEEDTALPVRASGSRRPRSLDHAVPPSSASASHARQSQSPIDELDILKHSGPKAAPVLKLATPPPPPSPIDMGMDVDFDRPFSPLPSPENSSGTRHISLPQKESPAPVREPSSFANPERDISVPIQTTESSKSPPYIAQGTSLFGLPTGLSSATPTAIQPPLPADTVSQNDMPPDSPPRALAKPQSSVPASPVGSLLVRTPPPAENATRTPEPEPSAPTSEATKVSRPASILPPIRRPFQSQIRTEPSVPPHPAPNAMDLGDRHHPPGSLFGFSLKKPIKTRDMSNSGPSSNASTSDSQTLTSAAAPRDSVPVNKEPVDASAGLQSNTVVASIPAMAASEGRPIGKGAVAAPRNKEVRKFVTSGLYRFPEGQSLSDVINRAYKPPPTHIDLTLDDSDGEPVMDVPASAQHNARNLSKFLALDNEEIGIEEVVQPIDSNHDRLLPHIERLLMQSYSRETPQPDPVGSAGVPVPTAKPRTNLDSIRSLIKKHQVQAKKTTRNPLPGNKVETVAPVPPISLSVTQSSGTVAQPTSPPAISTQLDDGPSVVDALALSMHDAEDVQMEDLPTTEEPPPFVPQSESVCNDDLSVNPPPSAPTDQDALEDLDDIRNLRSRKQRVPLARASSSPDAEDAEEVAFDLMYPESESVATGSPLKNEITRRSSPDPSPPPLSTRTSSRLSSRSASSSSGDPMATTENEVEDDIDVDIYEPRSDNLAADDSPYITWRSVRRAARERPPKFLKAQDLPHRLQDYLNAMPAMYRKTDEARLIFEAAIRESTVDDEPDAPPIEFHNKYDDEVTPPWEFHYTNKMWHGEGVPGPDMKSLQGCDCEGRCDPKSKTCLCVKKQSKYLERAGFVYNDKGRLIDALHYPIFECNDFCGCGEECQNRVVQHGRKCIVNIVKTKDKGWGVFAGPKRIPAGTFVGIYSGELLTEAVGQERGLKYDIFGRTYLFNIDGYHLQQEDPNWEVSYVVDAYHAGNFTRFLNHSCEPNCMVTLCYINEGDKDKPLVTIFTQQDVEPWGELSFCYSGITDEDIAIANRTDEGAVYAQCLCGAPGCRGVMFK